MDKENLKKLSDKDIVVKCSLDKELFKTVCDEFFFEQLVKDRFQKMHKFWKKEFKIKAICSKVYQGNKITEDEEEFLVDYLYAKKIDVETDDEDMNELCDLSISKKNKRIEDWKNVYLSIVRKIAMLEEDFGVKYDQRKGTPDEIYKYHLKRTGIAKKTKVDEITKDIDKKYILQLLGKTPDSLVSDRSLLSVRRLIADLRVNYPGLILSKTADNGDCYYDAFAQSLSEVLRTKITLQDLRKIAFEYINNPKSNPKIIERAKKILKENFEEYANFVRYDMKTSREKGRYPVWGNTQVDGWIFMEYFDVKIREISEGFIDESLKMPKLASSKNRVYGDVLYTGETSKSKDSPVVLIANIPNHYLAILGNTTLETNKMISQDRLTNPV
jgi:hypothetical protein